MRYLRFATAAVLLLAATAVFSIVKAPSADPVRLEPLTNTGGAPSQEWTPFRAPRPDWYPKG